ncbi:histidine kinase [Nonomuraea sp. NPDC046570]|uniref:sensor histidine kinase n=1 Tax=Nonomuraea sp. NPDC046570 TaxID=3155255 RepID=UPI0033E2D7BB
MKHLRRTGRQTLRDLGLWLPTCVLLAAYGPDPLDHPGAFAAVTGGRWVLVGLAVLVGRPWPPAAVALLLPLGPWDFAEGLATTDLSMIGAGDYVKIFPLAISWPALLTYTYLSGRRTVRVWPALAVFALAAGTGAGAVLARGGGLGMWITMGSGLLGLYALPYLVGVVRRRMLEQRERTRRSAEEQARLRERTRIAHDMHDSLGHDLALIAVRAAGLEVARGLDPEHARAAGELRLAAGEATERLRQIVGLLRDTADSPPLTPVDEGVTDLVERARASGMTITLETGDGPVPAIAHRVVQEGLTNAAKHAPGAPVEVSIGAGRVSVRNGPPPGRPVAATSGGVGLTALHERVRLAGGTLEAGPSQGGFALIARL